ncbi:MAG TPA: hypothetical protein VFK02_15655, partial [Kofleriaceae bacterium]|nr:hypothetical protein [Kofleriaceae bacterium]
MSRSQGSTISVEQPHEARRNAAAAGATSSVPLRRSRLYRALPFEAWTAAWAATPSIDCLGSRAPASVVMSDAGAEA